MTEINIMILANGVFQNMSCQYTVMSIQTIDKFNVIVSHCDHWGVVNTHVCKYCKNMELRGAAHARQGSL